MTPPHDIIGKPVSGFLPAGDGGDRLRELMGLASGYLLAHPVNKVRRDEGKACADSFWFWGGGRRPRMRTLRENTGLSGAVISAVDLVNGIGVLAGLERITVPGATGYVDSNFRGKAEYALAALARHDVVFVHMEAPDEAGHQGERDLKLLAIEKVDGEFLGPLLAGLPAIGDCRILVSPDHPTPLATRTHAADMVPFIIWPSPDNRHAAAYHEKAASESGLTVEKGHRLLERLIAGS
jgi:2,3-bisphosphoglycerate-independent phosphoglycerate mutase